MKQINFKRVLELIEWLSDPLFDPRAKETANILSELIKDEEANIIYFDRKR